MSKGKNYPVNEKIWARELRVIGPKGENLGVMSREEALKKAQEYNLDLVVVSTRTTPNVAKVLDFNKFIFDKRKEKQKTRKGKRTETKTLRFKPNIDEHDLQVRIARAKRFLEEGDKVKFEILFHGRMITRKELGHEKLDRIMQELNGIAEVDKERWMDGKRLLIIVKPK